MSATAGGPVPAVAAGAPPSVLCLGRGYACRFAGWALRLAGLQVELARSDAAAPPSDSWPDEIAVFSADQIARRLGEVDICVTDDAEALAAQTGGQDSWPADLARLVLVDMGQPAAQDDANTRIAELSGVGATIGQAHGPGLAPPGRMLEALVGLQAATAAMAAWLGAVRDGVGEQVRIDPVHCIAAMSGVNAIQFLDYNRPWRRAGRSASGSGGPFPFRLFRCQDGWLVVICRSRSEWQSFLDLLGNPPWSSLERFADPLVIATDHADEADALITEALSTRRVDELVAAARRHRVPLAPLRSTDEALADRRLFADAERCEPVEPITVSRPDPRPVAWRSRPPAAHRLGRAGPLAGLRVLDMGWVWAAPIAAAWLADLGADVVKVESLDSLDVARRRGLEFPAGSSSSRSTLPGFEKAWLFNATNRNKRSIRLELKRPDDHAAFMRLVARADVVLESFSSGVMERLAIAPETLLSHNPDLIVVSMGGRTVDGEFVSRSYAPVLSALAGLEASVVDPGGDPLGLLNWGVADPNAGAWAAFGVVAALATGRGGSHLLVSQLRALVNTCLSVYRGTDPPRAELPDAQEVTRAHLDGTACGPLGDVYRAVVVHHWSPLVGIRRAFVSPWQFLSMTVGVAASAPTLGSTSVEEVSEDWGIDDGTHAATGAEGGTRADTGTGSGAVGMAPEAPRR